MTLPRFELSGLTHKAVLLILSSGHPGNHLLGTPDNPVLHRHES